MARTNKLAASVAAVLIAMWPMYSFAEEGPYDPLGLRFGGFDVHASADLGAESTDNLFATPDHEESDVARTVGVDVSAASHWSRHSLSADIGYENRKYDDHSSEDTEASHASLAGRLDVYHDTEVGGSVSWAQGFEPRTDADSPGSDPTNPALPGSVLTLEPVQYNVASADVYALHTFNRIRISARASQSKYDYQDVAALIGGVRGTLDQDIRDYDVSSYGGRVEYGVSPRIYLLVDASANNRNYDVHPVGTASRDSNGNNILGGLRLQLTDLLVGEISAGRFSQDYDDPTVGTIKGTSFASNLTWYPTPIMNVQFSANRGVQEAGAIGGSAFIGTDYGVRINHSPRRFLNLSAGVHAGTRDYKGTLDRDDKYVGADLSAVYVLNRRVQIRAGYNYDRNRSSGSDPSNEFNENRFSLGLGLRL